MVGANLPDQNAKTVGGKRFPVTCLNQICGVVARCCFFNKCYFYNNEQQRNAVEGSTSANSLKPMHLTEALQPRYIEHPHAAVLHRYQPGFFEHLQGLVGALARHA